MKGVDVVVAGERKHRNARIPSPATMLPKRGPNLWALIGAPPKLGPDLWALTGGTRLIPPNFLGVVRRLFRGGPPKKCQALKCSIAAGEEINECQKE